MARAREQILVNRVFRTTFLPVLVQQLLEAWIRAQRCEVRVVPDRSEVAITVGESLFQYGEGFLFIA